MLDKTEKEIATGHSRYWKFHDERFADQSIDCTLLPRLVKSTFYDVHKKIIVLNSYILCGEEHMGDSL